MEASFAFICDKNESGHCEHDLCNCTSDGIDTCFLLRRKNQHAFIACSLRSGFADALPTAMGEEKANKCSLFYKNLKFI